MEQPKTLYLDVSDIKLIVSRIGLTRIIDELVEVLKEDFSNWSSFEKSPRTANHIPTGVIELMPVSNSSNFSFKYVNGHPGNPEHGLPTIMAFGAFASMQNGYPLLLSEMTILTAIRTAATSVLAAKYLARSGSRKMAMIGNGAQSEFQIIAFSELAGIDEVSLFDVDSKATTKLLKNMTFMSGRIKIKDCRDTASAVSDVDIITTCTADKKRAKIITDSMVKPGQHINALGGDCPGKTELEAKILERSRVIVEYTDQSRIEGEIQQMPNDFPVTELHEIIKAEKAGRETDQDITVFDSVGFALEDYSVLRYFYDKALELGIGAKLNLVPEMNDVKDLYGIL